MSVFANKTCLITGATGGLGQALAREFGRRECRLVLTGRDPSKLQGVATRLAPEVCLEGKIAADLESDDGVVRLMAEVNELCGGVDILVNNAGVFPVGTFESLSPTELDACLAVNLRAPTLLCQAFAGGMKARGWGRIVNIGSSSAYGGFANTAAYCASKHGLLGLSRALDDELRPHGVRVIVVSPGSIKTPMGRKVGGQSFETFLEPGDVAELCAQVAALDGNLIINELRLGRMVVR